MRVLMVNRGMDIYGGAEQVIVKLANYLSEKGVENAILTTRMAPQMEKDLESTEIIFCGDYQKASGIPSRILATAHIGEMIALHRGVHKHARDFELINVHNYPSELASFLCDVPVVWMCNEPELYLSLGILTATGPRIVTRVLWKLDRTVTRRYVTRAVVADEFNAERFKRLFFKDPVIINYGIDFDYFSAGTGAAVAERLGLSDKFVVLHVGMLNPFKNQMASLKVADELREKIPDLRLVLAGSDENAQYARMLREYVEKKNLGKQVIFTGHVDRGTVRDLYHAADMLLHPIGSQGGWLAPFEALCAQTPVVVSPDMTASEIIKRNSIGVVTRDYAGAVVDVHDRPQLHDRLAQRGAKYIRENLSWDEYCRKMLDLFREVGE